MGVRHGCLFWTPLPTTLSLAAYGIRSGCLVMAARSLFFVWGGPLRVGDVSRQDAIFAASAGALGRTSCRLLQA